MLKCFPLCDSKHAASMVNIFTGNNPVEHSLSGVTKRRIHMMFRRALNTAIVCLLNLF